MRLLFIAGLALLIAGCATSFSTMDKTLPKLKGQSIEQAINYLGIPDDKKSLGDQDVYVWQTSEMFQGEKLECKIKALVKNNIVSSFEYSGANGTCMQYSERLKPLLK